MKISFIAAALLLITGSLAFDRIREEDIFKQLHKLEGNWIMKTKRGFIGEAWKKESDHLMRGHGFMVKGPDTIVTERVILTKNERGVLYTSTVEDQNSRQPVSFKLSSSDHGLFVFENALHDFPKRIVYHIISPDSLHAYIDGGIADEVNRKHFYYNKSR